MQAEGLGAANAAMLSSQGPHHYLTKQPLPCHNNSAAAVNHADLRAP